MRNGGVEPVEAVARVEELVIGHCHRNGLYGIYRSVAHRLDILEKQILGNMLAQRAQQIELFALIHFEQESAPALVKYHNHIGMLLHTPRLGK